MTAARSALGRSLRALAPVQARVRPGRRAFTITEMLVVIAVVALILAIAIPSLWGARSRARMIVSASNLRQIGGALAAYAGASDSRYPAVESGILYPLGPATTRMSFQYWQIFHAWPAVIYDHLPRDEHPRVFISPGVRGVSLFDTTRPPSYWLSQTVAGDPALWDEQGPIFGESMRSARRQEEVAFPSSKAIMFDAELGWLGREPRRVGVDVAEATKVLLGDGAVISATPADGAGPTPNRDPIALMREHRLLNTAMGVRGQDF